MIFPFLLLDIYCTTIENRAADITDLLLLIGNYNQMGD